MSFLDKAYPIRECKIPQDPETRELYTYWLFDEGRMDVDTESSLAPPGLIPVVRRLWLSNKVSRRYAESRGVCVHEPGLEPPDACSDCTVRLVLES